MKLFPRFVLMPCVVLFVVVQTGFSEPFEAETDSRENPCQVVVKYFQALQSGDLAAARSHTMNGQDELTQNEVDQARGMLGNQKLTIHVAFSTLTRHRAIVVSGPFVLTPPKETGIERETRRFVFDLDDTLGRWLIRDTDFQTDEKAAETVVAFRRDFSDSREVSPSKSEPENTEQNLNNGLNPNTEQNPLWTVDVFFRALIADDLKLISTVLPGDGQTVTQNKEVVDLFRKGIGNQPPPIDTALFAPRRHRALVITGPLRIALPGENPPPMGRLILTLDETRGKWLVQGFTFQTDEKSSAAVAEFREKYGEDVRAIPVPEASPATAAKLKRKLMVFRLENADAKSVASTLDELFVEFSIVVDERTNSLFVRNPAEVELDELTAVLKLLDEPAQQEPQPALSNSALNKLFEGPMPGSVTEPLQGGSTVGVDVRAIYDALEAGVDEEYVAEVRSTAEAAETNSIRAAEQIRSQMKDTKDPAKQEELRQQLRRLVVNAFMERQSLQKSELVLVRNRLKKIEAQIQSREALRERIIDHRVDELLDPALRWAAVGNESAGTSLTRQKDGSPMTPLGGPAGLQQTLSPQALVQSGGGTPIGLGGPVADVQVYFKSPTGTKIVWSAHMNLTSLVVPARINLKPGLQHGFILAGIKGREGQQIAGSIEVISTTNRTAAFVSHNAIPLEFTEEDFDQVTAGNLVTKAIFLPDPEFQELAIAGVETLVSTRTDPGVDPVAEAGKRGVMLAILRLGNRVQSATLIGAPGSSDKELELEARIEDGFGILFFHSETCPECQKVKPEFTREMSRLGLPSLAVDVLRFPNIARRFRVSSTPTFVWYGFEVERGRATGSEFQPLVEKFKEFWEESGGIRSGYGFDGGLRGFLRRELVKAQASHESLMTDITALTLIAAELSSPVRIPTSATDKERNQLELEESRRKAKLRELQERQELLKDEARPVEARIILIRQRLSDLDADSRASSSSDPHDAVVWVEAIIDRSGKPGQPDAEARYMNGTVVSADGRIAVWLGHGSTMADALKFLRKIIVRIGGASHQAKLIAYDPQTGAAILRIEAAGLPFLRISDDPIATNRRLTVHARYDGDGKALPASFPVLVSASRFKVGDHDGFFAVAEASQNSITEEYAGAPVVTASGLLQGILAERAQILYGPGSSSEDPAPPRAAAIPASVIQKLLTQPAAGTTN